VLLDLSTRCGDPAGRSVQFSVKLTHQVLADLSGAHRATVTTLLNDWLYDGVIAMADGFLGLRRPRDLWILAGYHPSESNSEG
jgi:CRP-like cAMP-binding protein